MAIEFDYFLSALFFVAHSSFHQKPITIAIPALEEVDASSQLNNPYQFNCTRR